MRLTQKIKRLILIRLLFGSLLLYAPTLFRPEISPIFYTSSVLIGLVTAFYVIWVLFWRHFRWLAITQIAGDILLEGYLVYVSGGAESLFAILFVLSILSAALILGERRWVTGAAFFSSVVYLITSLTEYQSPESQFLPRDPLYFSYALLVRVVIFMAVGGLSRYLSGSVLELQTRLELSERLSLLGEVVSKISHEVRNPLSSIRTAAEVLDDSLRGKLSDQDAKMMEIVKKESDRLTQTLQRILNYAKQTPPNAKSLVLDEIVERVLNLARLNLGVHFNGVVVEKKYDPQRTHFYADEEQALGAFLNLTLNALQAMNGGGSYQISAVETGEGTTIDFEDNGGGIPDEKLKELFVPFKSTKKGGTGLGLAEVHKIVTLHKGKISVESQKGKGTRFRLFFPNA